MEATGLWAYVRGLGSFWGFGIQGFKGCRASFLILDIRDIYIYVYVYIYIYISRIWISSMYSSLMVDSPGTLGVKLVQHTVVVNSKKQWAKKSSPTPPSPN